MTRFRPPAASTTARPADILVGGRTRHIRSSNRATHVAVRTNLAKAQGGDRSWQQGRRMCVGSVSRRSFREFFGAPQPASRPGGGEELEGTFLSSAEGSASCRSDIRRFASTRATRRIISGTTTGRGGSISRSTSTTGSDESAGRSRPGRLPRRSNAAIGCSPGRCSSERPCRNDASGGRPPARPQAPNTAVPCSITSNRPRWQAVQCSPSVSGCEAIT
jgi:hypothetical protein